MSFWPNKVSISDVWIHSLGSLIAWLVWSIIIIIFTFALGDIVDFAWNFQQEATVWVKTSAFFPLVFSIVTFIGTSIAIYFTYFISHKINSQRYKRNIIIFWQIAFFSILTYLIITPVYIYAGMLHYDNLMYIFLAHCFIITFWTNIIIEVLNNYRHILIWLYGSFIGLFISIIITISIFSTFSTGIARMIWLLLLLPLINFIITFLKHLFEMIYYHYTVYTNHDGLWDIFYQIELEEKELLREEEEKNSI
jgi:hypothetical protein